MALEVGKLVARIELEGSFDQQLAKARAAFDETRRSAEDLDKAVSGIGKSAKFDFPTAPKQRMDDAKKSASDLGDGIKKATDAGRKMDVSDAPAQKLIRLNSTTRDYGVSLKSASDSGKKLTVSDAPKQTLSETASIADQVDSKFKGLGITMKGLAVTAGAAGFGAVMMKGWDRITAIDSAQAKLKGLGHEASNVETIMGDALSSVRGTSFGLGDAAGIAASAVAAGIQPGKELERTLKLTGDAATIAGRDLGSMGSIINKVATSDMMQMDTANQLMDSGIPILQMVAAELGVTAEEARKMASDGEVSFATFQNALEAGLGGAALASGETLRGSLANVGAAIGRLGAAAIGPFTDQILGAAAGATDFADTLGSALAPAAKVAATGLGAVGSVIGMIPGPVTAAVAALLVLNQTGLGASMAGAAKTAATGIGVFGVSLKESIGSISSMGDALGKAKGGFKSVVDMLGGPWMIGLAAAGIAIGAMVDSASRAREANAALADAATAGAAAQRELGDSLLRSNGLMDDQARAASEQLINTIVEGTRKAAESATGAFSIVDGPMHRMRNNYEALAGAVDNYAGTANEGLVAANLSRLEMQALDDALSETGFSMDELNAIVANGGPRWEMLRGALTNTGAAGEAMIGKLEGGQEAIEKIVESATGAERASMLLADAFRVMADESSTAEDKTNALKAALDALAGETLTADLATGKYFETMRKLEGGVDGLTEGGGNFTKMVEGQGIAFDTSSEKGFNLHKTLLDMRDATAEVRNAGGDMAPIWEQNNAQMEKLAQSTGLSTVELWKLAEQVGFIPEAINTIVSVDGAGAVAGELGLIASALKDVEKGAEVEVKNVGDDALNYLQAVGWEAQRIPGTTDIRVTAQTAAAQAQLQGTIQMASNLAAADPDVNVESNADFVTVALGLTADAVNQLPDGHVEITDSTPENMARLEALGIETRKDKTGRVLINDADVDRARGRVNELNNIKTESRHTVIIGTVNRGGNDASTAGITVGQHYADGGIRSFADGGTLPNSAVIQQPKGKRGLVQWAEAETGGEAFIPLAPAKRNRSLSIWQEVGKRLGVRDGVDGDMGGLLRQFANGGIMASGLIDLAKGVEGKPYVWGGVQYGDCSGAVSSLANYVSGRAPFGSRFATGNQREALRERGFVSGRGGAGDLKIGWYNGGPYGGHTSATLPNGVNFEMGGARGNGQYGGQAVGSNWSQYTDHAYFPMSRFADIDAAVSGDAVSAIASKLGTGNPSLPNDSGSPSASGVNLTVSGDGGVATGTPVYVTNWPSGGSGASVTAAITGETGGGGFIEGVSLAGMIANATGHGDLIKPVETFANGGFAGLENHQAQIAGAGSWRVWGEPETGGEAYIPLASHKRARSTAILAETAKRFGYQLGAGVNLAGSALIGGGFDTGWAGPSLSEVGIDGNALQQAYAGKVQQAMVLLVEAHSESMQGIDRTLADANAGAAKARQNYAGALI